MNVANKLLYLEDDDALAVITSKALKRNGFEVHHYTTVGEAKSEHKALQYTHALLDMKLEDGNSLPLISELCERHEKIKIVLLTGYASIATAVHAVKSGAYNYLPKPASIEDILNAFDEQKNSEDLPEEGMSLKRLEWEKIQHSLAKNGGNITLTAQELNMHRRTLQRKLNKRPVLK